MLIDRVKQLSPMDRLLYWMSEREYIRIRRLHGQPPPWTDDEILQRYRFCNVRRMDDRVSQWLLKHWYQPYRNHPNMLLACTMARFFNLPNTLSAIGFPEVWNADKVRRQLRQMQKRGTIFNSAYMVRGNDGVDKIACVINYTAQRIVKHPPIIDSSSMENSWSEVLRVRGMGSFMAGQVVADMRWGINGSWSDKHSWAPLGPGSRRGMNRLLSRPIESPMNQLEFNGLLMELMITGKRELSSQLTDRLEAIDWQNVCCEYDKYERTIWGQGRPKRVYLGTM